MKRTIGWILAIAAILLLALPVLWLFSNMWGYGGMMGGYGMMGRGYGFVNPLGWLGMAFMWLFPVAILVLIVVGAVTLINALTRSANTPTQTIPPVSGRACQNCGKPAQVDWNTCPYCGQNLS
ncbi:MAG: zinc ribbon domain-containing protein [Anaerolineales bacterium]|nr:zinc ribbon domain-containing protein [Anaerolineales bacterium]